MNMHPKTPSAGRKPVFNRMDVIYAVLKLGVSSFSMRAVAQELGVQAPALYRVFPSREDLQIATVEYLARPIFEAKYWGDTWQECLTLFASRTWKVFSTHPELPGFIAQNPTMHIIGARLAGNVVQALVDLGIPGGHATAAFAFDFVGDTTMMTAMQMVPHNGLDARDYEEMMNKLGSPEYFDFYSMAEQGFLEQKLRFIIQGIEQGLVPNDL